MIKIILKENKVLKENGEVNQMLFDLIHDIQTIMKPLGMILTSRSKWGHSRQPNAILLQYSNEKIANATPVASGWQQRTIYQKEYDENLPALLEQIQEAFRDSGTDLVLKHYEKQEAPVDGLGHLDDGYITFELEGRMKQGPLLRIYDNNSKNKYSMIVNIGLTQ